MSDLGFRVCRRPDGSEQPRPAGTDTRNPTSEIRNPPRIMMATVKLASLVLLAGCGALTSHAGDWTRFRGPNGSGVSEDGALPGEIGADKNVLWKTALPKGKSSPVITADRIFLTGHENGRLLTLALQRREGEPLWREE